MKEFEINRKSWHYKIAKFGGFNTYRDSNICDYTKCCAYGVLNFIAQSVFVLCVIVLVSIMVVDFTLGVWFWFKTGFFMMGEPGLIFLLVLASIVVFCAAGVGYTLAQHQSHSEPGFIRVAFSSFKGKYCHRIKVI